MSHDSLNDNMTIKLPSANVDDFDPIPAIQYWSTGGQRARRPLLRDNSSGRSTGIQGQPKEDSSDSDTESDASITEEESKEFGRVDKKTILNIKLDDTQSVIFSPFVHGVVPCCYFKDGSINS